MNILNYTLINEFKKQFYKNLLTTEHVQGEEVRMDKITYSNGEAEEFANIWGYILKKDNIKYILQINRPNNSFYKLKDLLPVMARDTEKVAYRGVSYQLISKPVSAKFQSKKMMEFKMFVDKLSSHKHSNPDHQKLLWFIGLSHILDRSNSRISTPPSFGKDSVVDIIGNLFGNACTIVSPTLAKMEYMTNFKWVAVNEVVDITKDKWRDIEQFLLDAGAFKPEIAKHSRAISNGVKEILDISEFSLSLLYNDIDNYTNKTQYFDSIAKDALKDRFPAFRLYGGFTEDFSDVRNVNIKDFVSGVLVEYKDLLYTFTYFKDNLYGELHHFRTEVFNDLLLNGRRLPERWKLNIQKILKMVDLYCDGQKEFDEWCIILRDSLIDYNEMLKYPSLVEGLNRRLSGKKFSNFMKGVVECKTFTQKNLMIKNYKEVGVRVEDTKFWQNEE